MTTLEQPPHPVHALLTADLLSRFDTPGPRYTSYPTADRFASSFGEADTLRALSGLSEGKPEAPLSLYVHIPFCESVCYYCACNKVITKHHERSTEYLDALETELELLAESFPEFKPQWTVPLGVQQLYDEYIRIGLDEATLTSASIMRIAHVRELLESGRISSDLRFVDTPEEALTGGGKGAK